MKAQEIKEVIIQLAERHKAVEGSSENDWEFESIEQEAEELIAEYATQQGYSINGFPQEAGDVDKNGEDYCHEHYQLYLDTLALEKEDVAELMWAYVSAFWPDKFSSKGEYLDEVKGLLDSGVIYDVEL